MSISVVEHIEAIFFDMNGTLRVREPHGSTQHSATRRILKLLGRRNAPDSFWELLTRRKRAYSQWAQKNLLQLSEEEIWTGWILPEYPSEMIKPIATDLTLAWSELKGRPVPRAGAKKILLELKRRGYRLGIISNSMSLLDIPCSLEAFGWKEYFDVVILSSVLKQRKPAPEPFWEAALQVKAKPSHCAYVGNRITKDIMGCKQAGFGMGILLEPPDTLPASEPGLPMECEVTIHLLGELLGIFPRRVASDIVCIPAS